MASKDVSESSTAESITKEVKTKEKEVPGWSEMVRMRWERTPWEGKIEKVNDRGACVTVKGFRGLSWAVTCTACAFCGIWN